MKTPCIRWFPVSICFYICSCRASIHRCCLNVGMLKLAGAKTFNHTRNDGAAWEHYRSDRTIVPKKVKGRAFLGLLFLPTVFSISTFVLVTSIYMLVVTILGCKSVLILRLSQSQSTKRRSPTGVPQNHVTPVV